MKPWTSCTWTLRLLDVLGVRDSLGFSLPLTGLLTSGPLNSSSGSLSSLCPSLSLSVSLSLSPSCSIHLWVYLTIYLSTYLSMLCHSLPSSLCLLPRAENIFHGSLPFKMGEHAQKELFEKKPNLRMSNRRNSSLLG